MVYYIVTVAISYGIPSKKSAPKSDLRGALGKAFKAGEVSLVTDSSVSEIRN